MHAFVCGARVRTCARAWVRASLLKTMEDDDDYYDEDVQQMKSTGTDSNYIFSLILPQNKLRIRSQNLPRHLGSYHVI